MTAATWKRTEHFVSIFVIVFFLFLFLASTQVRFNFIDDVIGFREVEDFFFLLNARPPRTQTQTDRFELQIVEAVDAVALFFRL